MQGKNMTLVNLYVIIFAVHHNPSHLPLSKNVIKLFE